MMDSYLHQMWNKDFSLNFKRFVIPYDIFIEFNVPSPSYIKTNERAVQFLEPSYIGLMKTFNIDYKQALMYLYYLAEKEL